MKALLALLPPFTMTVHVLGNLYLFHWVIRWIRPAPILKWALGLFFLLLVLSHPVSRVLGRYDFNSFNQELAYVGRTWLGFTLYLGFFAVVSDLLRLAGRIVFRRGLSAFHSRLLGVGIGMAVALIGGYMIWEARQLEVTHLEIPLRKLPAALDGFSVVQISDVHYGMLHGNGRLGEIVRRVNELKPDLVVITGDLVDEGVSHLEQMAMPLRQIQSRLGVFAVMGNHEAYAGVNRVESILKAAGVTVLRNERAFLPHGLQILGIDDPAVSWRAKRFAPNFGKLIAALNPEEPSILLYHPPRRFEEAAAARVGLQLSGHTHGPQLLLLSLGVKYFYPYTRGLFKRQESYLYVSRGVGTGGPPMRHGSTPEIVYIRLKAGK